MSKKRKNSLLLMSFYLILTLQLHIINLLDKFIQMKAK